MDIISIALAAIVFIVCPLVGIGFLAYEASEWFRNITLRTWQQMSRLWSWW